MKKKKRIKAFFIIVLCLIVLGAGTVFGVNGYIKGSTSERIISSEDAVKLPVWTAYLCLAVRSKMMVHPAIC